MKNLLLKTLLTVTLASCSLFSPTLFAADENIDITPDQQITHEELAAIYVLSEVCPPLVKDPSEFKKGYDKLVKEYLPSQKEAAQALDQLAQQSSFSSVLKEARADAQTAGDASNQAICDELMTY